MNPIAFVAIWLLGVVIMVWVARYGSKRGARSCPHCGATARVPSFGRFRCSVCGGEFVLSPGGKHTDSIGKALLVPMLFSVAVQAGMIGLWLYQHEAIQLLLIALLAVSQILGYATL